MVIKIMGGGESFINKVWMKTAWKYLGMELYKFWIVFNKILNHSSLDIGKGSVQITIDINCRLTIRTEQSDSLILKSRDCSSQWQCNFALMFFKLCLNKFSYINSCITFWVNCTSKRKLSLYHKLHLVG